MILGIKFTLPQGLDIPGAYIEVQNWSAEEITYKRKVVGGRRVGDQLVDVETEMLEEEEAGIDAITFTAFAWVNRQMKSEGKASFDVTYKGQKEIVIDFSQHPDMKDYFETFNESATNQQRVEATCDEFLKKYVLK